MTDEMLALAEENARKANVTNVHFLKGLIEEIPLEDASVDVVISNCVVNLSPEKPKVLAEIVRAAPEAESGSRTSSRRIGSPQPIAPHAGATSAALPARSQASTARGSPTSASSMWRWSSRTRSRTACTARSSKTQAGLTAFFRPTSS